MQAAHNTLHPFPRRAAAPEDRIHREPSPARSQSVKTNFDIDTKSREHYIKQSLESDDPTKVFSEVILERPTLMPMEEGFEMT